MYRDGSLQHGDKQVIALSDVLLLNIKLKWNAETNGNGLSAMKMAAC